MRCLVCCQSVFCFRRISLCSGPGFWDLKGDRPPLRRQASVSALTPPCGARKTVRACAFPPAFRPLRKWSAAFFCPRQRWCSIPPGTSFTTAPVRSTGSQAKTKKHPIGCFSCFGGLEGDRTLEPHGCEPCALPLASHPVEKRKTKMKGRIKR